LPMPWGARPASPALVSRAQAELIRSVPVLALPYVPVPCGQPFRPRIKYQNALPPRASPNRRPWRPVSRRPGTTRRASRPREARPERLGARRGPCPCQPGAAESQESVVASVSRNPVTSEGTAKAVCSKGEQSQTSPWPSPSESAWSGLNAVGQSSHASPMPSGSGWSGAKPASSTASISSQRRSPCGSRPTTRYALCTQATEKGVPHDAASVPSQTVW